MSVRSELINENRNMTNINQELGVSLWPHTLYTASRCTHTAYRPPPPKVPG